MFDAKDEVKESIDALMRLASDYSRGQCISWGEIEAITGNRFENRARYVIRKWRRRMRRVREIPTLIATDVGVRLLTHLETATEIPDIAQKSAYRKTRRAIDLLSTVDEAHLSDHQRRVLSAQRSNLAEQRRALFRSRKQLATGIVTEGNPRRMAPAGDNK
jgi:hypothetical protein